MEKGRTREECDKETSKILNTKKTFTSHKYLNKEYPKSNLNSDKQIFGNLCVSLENYLVWSKYDNAYGGSRALFIGHIVQAPFIIASIYFIKHPQISKRDGTAIYLLISLVILFYVNTIFCRYASPYFSKQRLDKARDDARIPSIYLRSFSTDSEKLYTEANITNPRRGSFLFRWDTWNLEDELSEFLSPYAPMITVGRPGDELPRSGAIRFYVRDSPDDTA
jgi:hypothetical protein